MHYKVSPLERPSKTHVGPQMVRFRTCTAQARHALAFIGLIQARTAAALHTSSLFSCCLLAPRWLAQRQAIHAASFSSTGSLNFNLKLRARPFVGSHEPSQVYSTPYRRLLMMNVAKPRAVFTDSWEQSSHRSLELTCDGDKYMRGGAIGPSMLPTAYGCRRAAMFSKYKCLSCRLGSVAWTYIVPMHAEQGRQILVVD